MRLERLLSGIDQINRQDPNQDILDGRSVAREYLYSQRMKTRLSSFYPQAPETLQIAVYAQHINRWHIARDSYPEGRVGYLKWRKVLALHHAELTADLMQQEGYSEEDRATVKRMILKQNLKTDPLTQTLEDVACLVFLEFYLAPMTEKHSREKLIAIIRKTWKKMSHTGQRAALKIDYPDRQLALIQAALDNAPSNSDSSS